MKVEASNTNVPSAKKARPVVLDKIARELKTPQDLRDHILGTYHMLRLGMGIVAVALPVVLWVVGGMVFGLSLQGSMSAYYRTPMRDVFVGGLWAIGAFLYLYKGYSNKENIALNIGGISAALVGVFPLDWNPTWIPFSWINPHGFFAVLFFLCIVYVCLVCADDTLHLGDNPTIRSDYKRAYSLLGILMIVIPLGIWVAVGVLKVPQTQLIFFLEAVSIWIFGSYWFIKSREFQTYTDAEDLTLQGEVRREGDTLKKELGANQDGLDGAH